MSYDQSQKKYDENESFMEVNEWIKRKANEKFYSKHNKTYTNTKKKIELLTVFEHCLFLYRFRIKTYQESFLKEKNQFFTPFVRNIFKKKSYELKRIFH